MRELSLVDGVRSLRRSGSVPFDERDLVALIVVAQLIDHPPRDHEPKSSGAKTELVADVEMRERVVVRRGVGDPVGVESGTLVADDDLDAIVEEPVADVDELLDVV